MNYEASTYLSDIKFKRLFGVERQTFNEIFVRLEQIQASIYQKGKVQIKPYWPFDSNSTVLTKISYLRTNRLQIDFNIHKNNLIRINHWAEATLVQNGFHS